MKTIIIACVVSTGLIWILWYIFLHKDISERVVHGGFAAPLVKIVFNGQQKIVELDDPESLLCVQKAVEKSRIGADAGTSYEANFYLANGEVDTLRVYVLNAPPELTINVWEKISHDSTGSVDYVIPDPVLYCAKFEEPPHKLVSCLDILLGSSTGNFTIK